MNDVHTRLRAIFREIFDDESLDLLPQMTAASIAGWDSLTHINLIVAIEKAFRIRFTTAEVSGLKDVGALEALVASKVRKQVAD
jgi:acyl carrier protein